MEVVLQYFDDCPNWRDTRGDLEVLAAEGFDIDLRLQRITTVEEAEVTGFRGSPTVLIDGRDPFADQEAPVGLACRIYRTPDGLAGTPTRQQLREALGGA